MGIGQKIPKIIPLTPFYLELWFEMKRVIMYMAITDIPVINLQTLLKELEEFAHKGIPDVRGCKAQDAQILEEMVCTIFSLNNGTNMLD